jgi:hypothetical protein
MALQRTRRPRFRSGRSLRSLGSPLNARPLGGRSALLSVALSICLIGCTTTGRTPSPDIPLESLSGEWEGKLTIVQTGSCPVGRGQEKGINVRFAVKVTPDGDFTGTQGPPFDSDESRTRWMGRVDRAFQLTITKVWTAVCGSETLKRQSQLSGRIVETSRGLELRIGGQEEWCPERGCSFRVTYVLAKR